MQAKKIYIVDDHLIFRMGLKLVLKGIEGYEVAGEAENGKYALGQIKALKPDIVITDISMPDVSGIELSAQLQQALPGIKVLILSTHNDAGNVAMALRSGIAGYLLKDTVKHELALALGYLSAGKKFFSPGISEVMAGCMAGGLPEENEEKQQLSEREQAVLRLIVEGYSNNEIADQLFISPKTVGNHRANIIQKLGVRNTASLVSYAIRHQLV